MGFLDFLKPKKKGLNDVFERMSKVTFPNGKEDIDAATNEVNVILGHKLNYEEARSIALKSVLISRVSQDFTVDRLKAHLAGYALQHFNERQVDELYTYLNVLKVAMALHSKGPSKIKRDGDKYLW